MVLVSACISCFIFRPCLSSALQMCAEQCWPADKEYYIVCFFLTYLKKKQHKITYIRQHLLWKPGPGELLLGKVGAGTRVIHFPACWSCTVPSALFQLR